VRGSLGLGHTTTPVTTPTRVGTDTDWSFVVSSVENTLALKTNNRLYAWGRGSYRLLGNGSLSDVSSPVLIGTDTWRSISCGRSTASVFVIGIKTNGSMWAWGTTTTSMGGAALTASPIRITSDTTNWVTVRCGDGGSYALKQDGTLWAWGLNTSGQLGIGNTTSSTPVVQVGTDNNWSEIYAGWSHVIARKSNGTFWGWGTGLDGQLLGSTSFTSPTQISGLNNIRNIYTGNRFSGFLSNDGTIQTAGFNSSGQLGNNSTISSVTSNPGAAIRLSILRSRSNLASVTTAVQPIVSLSLSPSLSLHYLGANPVTVTASGGTGYSWSTGVTTAGISISSPGTYTVQATQSGQCPTSRSIQVVSQPAFCEGDTILLTAPLSSRVGTAYSWTGPNGFSASGSGFGSIFQTRRPEASSGMNGVYSVSVSTPDSFVSLAVGHNHMLAIREDGTLWAWGGNANGQLGLGHTNNVSVPTQVGTGNRWLRVAAGGNFSVAMQADSSIWAWGVNASGQLGDGTTVQKLSPVRSGTKKDWQSFSVGYDWVLAISQDGTLWAWGNNSSGQLGNNTTTNVSSPIQIGTQSNWVRVFATLSSTNDIIGGRQSYGIQQNGSLWSWGYCDGLGRACTNTTIPVQVGTDLDWVDVSGTDRYGFAIKTNGTLWEWGLSVSTTPRQLGSASNWSDVGGGGRHRFAINQNKQLFAWGTNLNGCLGMGVLSLGSGPSLTEGPSDKIQVHAGESISACLDDRGRIWTAGNNSIGSLGYGNLNSTDAVYGGLFRMAAAFTVQSPMGVNSVTVIPKVPLVVSPNPSIHLLSQGDSVLVSASGADTYQWSNGGTAPTQVLRNAGTYTVTASRSGFCSVTSAPIPVAFIQPACEGGNLTLSAPFVTRSQSVYTWQGPNGFSASNNSSLVTRPEANSSMSGIYTLSTLLPDSFISINAGDNHALAIRSDGSLWAWGANSSNLLFGTGSQYPNGSNVPVRVLPIIG
jgi:alpha-tubulin suppressor-like RCC1 family protein